MISYMHGFIFIHIPKTGGKSVRKALRPYTLNPRQRLVQYVATRTSQKDVYGIDIGHSHATAQDIRDIFGPASWNDFFSFAFVRNPWALVVSEYYFQRQRPQSKYHDLVSNGSLEDFVAFRHSEGIRQQIDYVRDEDGKRIVDFVGRVENYPSDFAHICARLRITAALPHKNRTQHRSYHEELSLRARGLVAELYADDIAEFGYSFE